MAIAVAAIIASYEQAATLRPALRRDAATPPNARAASASNGIGSKSASACWRRAWRAARSGPSLLLIGFIDLDGFKSVNDTFDHAVGDRVLASIAERLRRAFRSEDVVARYGGDEFVVVCKTQAGTSDGMVTSGVERALAEPVLWEGGSWNAKASIGTARVEPDDDVADLLRRADRNMYLAKAERRLDQAAS